MKQDNNNAANAAEKQHDDMLDFLSEMGDVKPLQQNDRVYHHNAALSVAEKQARFSLHQTHNVQHIPLSMEGVTPVQPEDYLEYKKAGIQDGVYKNLRLGKYQIDTRLNISGLSLVQTREQVYVTLQNAHNQGARCVLIQHGLGRESKPFPALKKSYVSHWLQEIDEVIAFHTAQPQHGGLGATYVLLKKHPEQKQINRERQRRRWLI